MVLDNWKLGSALASYSGMTKHNHQVIFGRKEAGCPRCLELLAGDAPRKGWSDYKRRFEAASLAAIKAHDCKLRHCGPVCTFGDW